MSANFFNNFINFNLLIFSKESENNSPKTPFIGISGLFSRYLYVRMAILVCVIGVFFI